MKGSGNEAALPAGVILAGGRSRRMGGQSKALAPLAGLPLLQHVIDRISAQVGRLYLSVQMPSDDLAAFGLPLVRDPARDAGPLAGLLAALRESTTGIAWMSVVPCDAPFLPRDLVVRLLGCALKSEAPGAVVRYRNELQPTFSIWSPALLPRLERAVAGGKMNSLRQFSRDSELAVLDWPQADPSPFFNVNDRTALDLAGRVLAGQTGAVETCSV